MKTVLIVDDEPLIRWALHQGLKDRFTAFTAGSVDEALSILASRSVDVIVVDLKMPGRSGMELVELVRRERPEVKIFVITAHGTDEDIERCYMLDVQGVIRKPFDLRLVRDMIELHLAWPAKELSH